MQPITRARALSRILFECQRESESDVGEWADALRDGECELSELLEDICAWQGRTVRERELRRMLFELVPAALVFVDGNGLITETNPAADALLGEDLGGRPFEDAVTFADSARAHGGADEITDALEMGFGFSRHRTAIVRVVAHPLHDGTERRLLIIRPTGSRNGVLTRELLRPLRRAHPLGGLRVLAVDNDATTRDVLTDVLSSHGARVTGASTADEALCVLGSFEFDVIVSDIVLPGLDGYAFIRQVRDRCIDVPAIGLARREAELDATRAREAGFDACIVDFPHYERVVRCMRQFHAESGAVKGEAILPRSSVRDAG